jgi:predicted nuclease with TOPRIM domain
LAVALCTIATAGVSADTTLSVLDVLSQFRKGQCYPIVASTSARGLLRNYRKSIRQLRNISLELLQRNRELQMIASSAGEGATDRQVKRNRGTVERNPVSSVIRAARADVGDDGAVDARGAAFGATEQQVAELALKYEERLVELSRQLLDAELENTVLREGIKADKRDIVVRVAELQQENLTLSEEAKDLGAAYDRMKTEFDDTLVELKSMQSNAKVKAKDARGMRERAAFLEQQVEMMQSQLRDMADRSPHFYPTVAPAIKDDSFFRQQSALLQICMRLRRRVAELTTDSSEFERLARTNLSLEMLVTDAPAESSGTLPDSAFVEADGKPVAYAEMTNRLHKCSQQNTRMRTALEQAAQHIRECHDQIKRMQSGRFAASGESTDTELARLRGKVDTYKAHLVKARDALVAAKTAKEARDKPQHVLTEAKDMELYRAELLKLQERCGKLSTDNERMRQALTSVVESTAVRPSDPSLPTMLVESERKLVTVLVENTDLQEQVANLRDQYDATVSRFEKIIAALRQDLDRSRSIIAQVTAAKAGLGASSAGMNASQ